MNIRNSQNEQGESDEEQVRLTSPQPRRSEALLGSRSRFPKIDQSQSHVDANEGLNRVEQRGAGFTVEGSGFGSTISKPTPLIQDLGTEQDFGYHQEYVMNQQIRHSETGNRASDASLQNDGWQTAFFQALQLLDREHAISMDPNASASVDSKRLKESLGLLNRAILKAPANQLAKCHSMRGYVHLLLRDFERAIDDCGEALRSAGAIDVRERLDFETRVGQKTGDGDQARVATENDAFDNWEPQHAEPLIWRACAEAAQKNWLAALIDIDHALLADSDRRTEVNSLRAQVIEQALHDYRAIARAGNATEAMFTERAKLYRRMGQQSRAERDLVSALEMAPSYVNARLELTRLRCSEGRWQEALGEVDRALPDADEKQQKHGFVLRACIGKALGDLEGATSDLRKLKSRFPDDIELRLVVAKEEQRLGNLPEAIEDLTWILRRERKNELARAERARAYIELRNDDLAIRDLHELLRRGSNRVEWYVWRGQAYLRQKRWVEAEHDFQTALEANELLTDAYVGMGEASAGQGKKELALSYCERALRLDSRSTAAHLCRAHLLIETGKAKAAQAELTRVIELSDSVVRRGEAYYLRGTVESYLKREQEAKRDFDKALECRPMHPGTLIWRSNSYRSQKNWARAIDDLELAMKVNPVAMSNYRRLGEEVARLALESAGQHLLTGENRAQSFWLMGRAKRLKGDANGAVADFRRAYENEPERWEIVRDLVIEYDESGDHDAAVEVLTRFLDAANAGMEVKCDPQGLAAQGQGIRLDSESGSADQNKIPVARLRHHVLALAYVERARLYLANKQPRTALADLNQAIELAPNNLAARLARGEHGMRSQHFESAIIDLNKALEISPGNHLVLACRGRVHYLNNQFLLAIRDFTQALDRFADQPAVHAARGHAYLKNHQADEAEKDFDAALAVESRELDAFTGKAIVLAKHGESEAALIWITKALHRFDQPSAWAPLLMTRGRIFYNASRFGRAILDYTQVIDWDVNSAETAAAMYARGVARLQEGDGAGARVDFEAALARESRFQPARLALQWMDGAVREKPKALVQPKRMVRPTRPRVVAAPREALPETENWDREAPFDQWIVRSDEMIEFGPCPKAVVDQWCREGRIDAETRLLRSDWSAWKRAAQVYPFLSKARAAKRSAHSQAPAAQPAPVGVGTSNASDTAENGLPSDTDENLKPPIHGSAGQQVDGTGTTGTEPTPRGANSESASQLPPVNSPKPGTNVDYQRFESMDPDSLRQSEE